MSFFRVAQTVCFTFLLFLAQTVVGQADNRLKFELHPEDKGFSVQLTNMSGKEIYIEKPVGGWYGCGNLEIFVHLDPQDEAEALSGGATCSSAIPTADMYVLLAPGEAAKTHLEYELVTERYSSQKGIYSYTMVYNVGFYSLKYFNKLVEGSDNFDFFEGILNSNQLELRIK